MGAWSTRRTGLGCGGTHKPEGLVTTHRDPEGRPTIFERMPEGLPRVISIGRLDLNSEGLLLLTNDGALKRQLELPTNGWIRRYRARVWGQVDERALARLAEGVVLDGRKTGPIEAGLDSRKGDNAWLTVSLREGRYREVRRVLLSLNLAVTRLIRIAYGPFQLGLAQAHRDRGGAGQDHARAARAAGPGSLTCGSWPAPGAGARLVAPPGDVTRPTADRVRQALFDMLAHAPWAPADGLRGQVVLDAFAGSGALGLEALSRGAARATFFERDPAALAALRSNVGACRTADATVLQADATRPPRARAAASLVFLDPPYGQGLPMRAVPALAEAGWIGVGALLVVETGRDEALTLAGWTVLAERAHGAAMVRVLGRDGRSAG